MDCSNPKSSINHNVADTAEICNNEPDGTRDNDLKTGDASTQRNDKNPSILMPTQKLNNSVSVEDEGLEDSPLLNGVHMTEDEFLPIARHLDAKRIKLDISCKTLKLNKKEDTSRIAEGIQKSDNESVDTAMQKCEEVIHLRTASKMQEINEEQALNNSVQTGQIEGSKVAESIQKNGNQLVDTSTQKINEEQAKQVEDGNESVAAANQKKRLSIETDLRLLEVERRLIKERIHKLENELERYECQRLLLDELNFRI